MTLIVAVILTKVRIGFKVWCLKRLRLELSEPFNVFTFQTSHAFQAFHANFWIKFRMTLIVTVILTKVRIYRFLTITQIPDQVRNDGTAVVIPELNSGQALTKVSSWWKSGSVLKLDAWNAWGLNRLNRLMFLRFKRLMHFKHFTHNSESSSEWR